MAFRREVAGAVELACWAAVASAKLVYFLWLTVLSRTTPETDSQNIF